MRRSATSPRARPTLRRRLAILAGSLVISLLLAELGARLLAPFELVEGDLLLSFGARTPEEDVRFETTPRATLWFRPHPGRAQPRDVPADLRVVVVSDSVLEPAGVADEEGAVALLAARLAALPELADADLEVVNLAEGGWNVVMYEAFLDARVWGMDPDLLLLGVTGNDTQQYAWRDGRLWDVYLVDALEGERAGAGPLARVSYLYNWLWLAFVSNSVASAQRQDDAATVERVVLGPIGRIADEAARRGVRLAVLCNPELDQDTFRPELGGCAFRELRGLLESRGVPYLDPWPRYAPAGYDAIALDGIHLNPDGHRILADALETWLAPVLFDLAAGRAREQR